MWTPGPLYIIWLGGKGITSPRAVVTAWSWTATDHQWYFHPEQFCNRHQITSISPLFVAFNLVFFRARPQTLGFSDSETRQIWGPSTSVGCSRFWLPSLANSYTAYAAGPGGLGTLADVCVKERWSLCTYLSTPADINIYTCVYTNMYIYIYTCIDICLPIFNHIFSD